PVFKRTYSDTSVVKYKKPQQLDLKIEDYISAGSKIGTNSELGDIYLDYSNIENLRDRLNCVDGQIVRAGDIILELKKTAIFGSKQIKAPVTGRVDFSLVDKGILIFKESKSEEVTIPFGGIYLSQDTTHLRIKTKTMNLFTSFHIGNITQGILIAKKDIERVVGEKILFLNRMSEYDLDFEKAQEQGIKGVMFLSLGFEEMLSMITKKEVQMGIVDLIICDQIGDSYIDDTLLSFIRKYYGYYISVEEGVIKIPVAKNNKFASPELQEDYFQIAYHKRLLKGEKIKVISYFDSHHYARIESISKNFVSVSNNSEILSINKANIYQYES
ncbi:hypothetical protein KC909_03150, partial [Candidatus Dojkabacteria bacterium]|nr:hypothetical protein [Candidatus Dojkabacteria bacterium]